MARPALRAEAARLYQQIEPPSREDERYGWTAALLCAALMGPLEDLSEWALASGDRPAYGVLGNPDECPDVALPWLALLSGVELTSEVAEEQRRQIRESHGRHRGSKTSLESDTRATLAGNRFVNILPGTTRWETTVVTRTKETPDEAATLAAVKNRHARPFWQVYTLVVTESPVIDEGTKLIDEVSATIDDATEEDVT